MGLGIERPVNSPTFTILQIYEEGRLPLYHFDVYRIGDSDWMSICLRTAHVSWNGRTGSGRSSRLRQSGSESKKTYRKDRITGT